CPVFPQKLRIEFLPDFSHLLTDEKIEIDGFFDFLNRVDGGGVVFAAKLAGNFWETKVEFAAEQVHGHLARYHDVLVAFGATHFFGVDLEMARGLVNDLLWRDVLRPAVADVADQPFSRRNIRSHSTHLGVGEQLVKGALELAD